MIVRPIAPQSRLMFNYMESTLKEPVINLNQKKIEKYLASKQGKEAMKRYENNLRLIDFWHRENDALVIDEASDHLERMVCKVFDKASDIEKWGIVRAIKMKITKKMDDAIAVLNDTKLYNVGLAGDEVLRCAMERDKHLEKVEAILNEARAKGQTKLEWKQEKKARREMKLAEEYDAKRMEYAAARLEAKRVNESRAAEKGPEVLAAYKYLYDMPE